MSFYIPSTSAKVDNIEGYHIKFQEIYQQPNLNDHLFAAFQLYSRYKTFPPLESKQFNGHLKVIENIARFAMNGLSENFSTGNERDKLVSKLSHHHHKHLNPGKLTFRQFFQSLVATTPLTLGHDDFISTKLVPRLLNEASASKYLSKDEIFKNWFIELQKRILNQQELEWWKIALGHSIPDEIWNDKTPERTKILDEILQDWSKRYITLKDFYFLSHYLRHKYLDKTRLHRWVYGDETLVKAHKASLKAFINSTGQYQAFFAQSLILHLEKEARREGLDLIIVNPSP